MVSSASLIASPHAKESGQTMLAVFGLHCMVQKFLGPGNGFECCERVTVRPQSLTLLANLPMEFNQTPSSCAVMQYTDESRRLAGETSVNQTLI